MNFVLLLLKTGTAQAYPTGQVDSELQQPPPSPDSRSKALAGRHLEITTKNRYH